MRIAIVCGHFIPQIGYIEVQLARVLPKLGHEVCVFTTDKVPGIVKGVVTNSFEQGTSKDDVYEYEVNRLPGKVVGGQMVRANGLKEAVDSWSPELVIT